MVAKKRVLDYNFRVLFCFKYSPVAERWSEKWCRDPFRKGAGRLGRAGAEQIFSKKLCVASPVVRLRL